MVLEVFFVAFVIGLVPAFIAQSKGKGFFIWWLYGSAIFISALPHALLTKPDAKTQEAHALADGGRKCPHCAEVVKVEARVCRFCQRDLPPIPVTAVELTFDEKKLIEQYKIVKKDGGYTVTYYEDFLKINRTDMFGDLQSALRYATSKRSLARD